MPEIQSIRLHNFKGAPEITIDISKSIDSPVITLIGLNESGKTTILEGLSYFASRDESLEIFSSVHSRSDITALIPLHKKAAFTGSIIIEGIVRIVDADLESSAEIAKKYNLALSKSDFPREIVLTQTYVFEDSLLKERNLTWDFPSLKVFSGRSAKARMYQRPSSGPDLWQEITDSIWKKIPRIAYFPTFLVDMPLRIYLREHKDEKAVDRYYREVFQDILDSLGEGLSLEKHVSKRIEDFKAASANPNWYSLFLGGPSKAPIDSVSQKISNAVTKEVLGSWRRVFQRPIAAKSISVEWNIDTQKGDLPYASFIVSDGESRYAISERSLGLRWFFLFYFLLLLSRELSDQRYLCLTSLQQICMQKLKQSC